MFEDFSLKSSRMFSNITVSIGMGAHLLFSIRTNQPEAYIRAINQTLPWSARKQYNYIKKDLKTNLDIHNTKGDVALTNILRETNYFHDFVQYSK